MEENQALDLISQYGEDEINKFMLNYRLQSFKRGDFDFIVNGISANDEGDFVKGDVATHAKQKEALITLTSNTYDQFLYGGAAGGAKSFTGMSWIVFSALSYPRTRYFIARNELKDIRESVLVTFEEVCLKYGINDYKYNSVLNFIKFPNGSEINLIEVKYKPSDPEYKDVGSTLYTCGWFEEVGEIHEKAVSVLTTRINRWNVDPYNLKGIVFLTGNPAKNWTKTQFYDKDKNGQMSIENKDEAYFKKKYLGCLVTENPFISQKYINSLKKQATNDKAIFERLFKGNWDYDDNPFQLADQEMIEQVFNNDHVIGGNSYIIADVARFGNDKAVIGYWKGWDLRDVIVLDVSKTTDIELAILTLRRKYKVSKNRVLIDDDGVGGGVTDATGGKGFRNASKPLKVSKDTPNYKNLQVQCLYLLADKINDGGLYISADLTNKEKEHIIAELAQIQAKGDHDPQRKLDCKSKADIKNDIGRSPDWRDMIMMRVFFDLKRERRPVARSRERGLF
ncbi:MAG: phage terminase large subunit [Saprospiraceae bacterium]